MQDVVEDAIVASSIASKNVTSKLEMLHSDLKRIHENMDRFKSSRKYKTCEELLQELMDAATHLTAADFLADSNIFMRPPP